jgi:HPt (histidine-containing phosphotransfer) domain-containing protein
MHEAFDSNDATTLARAAHSLKGAVANLAAYGVQQAADEVETAARNGDLGGVAAGLRAMQAEIDRLVPQLQQLCQD